MTYKLIQINEKIHRKLKVSAFLEGESIGEYTTKIICRQLKISYPLKDEVPFKKPLREEPVEKKEEKPKAKKTTKKK